MALKPTQEIALERARKCHGDLYDLSKLVYTATLGLVTIGCKKHGFFDICYRDFTKPENARGCQACSKEIYAATRGEGHNKIGEAEAMRRMVAAHADKFDYTKVAYTSFSEDVTITCPLHGDFSMSPQSHTLSQYGCLGCAYAAGTASRLNSRDDCTARANIIFGDTYDYSKVPEGICSKTKFSLVCKVHGEFTKTWNQHLKGDGCAACAREAMGDRYRSNTQDFIAKAEAVHGGTYDYSAVDYKRSDLHVQIICKTHGPFQQKPNKHLGGRGCNACALNGFRVAKPGYLYVFRDGCITKIGITNRKVSIRLSEINYSGKQFTLVHSQKYESGKDCMDVETSLLRYLRGKYEPCEARFNGSTECFMKVDLEDLMSKIEAVAEV